MAQFSGFSKEAFGFFKALSFHQNREWFHENKSLYESEVKEPMLALLEALSERFKKAKIPLRGDKKSVFRINRDVRFSKNKQPYQTHTGAVLTPSGAKDDPGLLYIHISAPDLDSMGGIASGSFVAAGFHQPETDQLTAFRTAIRKRPKAFIDMEAALKKAKLKLNTNNQLTRVPRGFEDMKESEVEAALRLKSYIVEEPLPASVVTSGKLVDRLVQFTERSMPLLKYGWKALK